MTTTTATPPPQRADARRNRQRLIDAATTVFAREGANAPLDRIARTAGIGNATMYRHFPSREALLEAVLHDAYREMTELAAQLAEVTPALTAVEQWLRAFIGYTQSYLYLPEPLRDALYDESSALFASCRTMREVAGHLVERAQQAGELRPDIDIFDLCVQANGIAWATQLSQDEAQGSRMLDMLINGLRIEHEAPARRRRRS